MYLKNYFDELGRIPDFLIKYITAPSLIRLKKIGYFCGMDYASKDIYKFREYISRYDHSLTVALIVYRLTGNRKATIAGLFHDVATPCFSHVIDYMNHDYEKQDSTELFTESILRNDDYLLKCLKEDNIDIKDIINFKKYTVVDNDRPKLCADRLDGVILTGIGWTKNITLSDITNILNDMCIFKNEYKEYEIGFNTMSVARKVIEVSNSIDEHCHTNEDNFMMELLANIARIAINRGYISYEDLYKKTEKTLLIYLYQIKDKELSGLITMFRNIKHKDIPVIDLPKVKKRILSPIVNGERVS